MNQIDNAVSMLLRTAAREALKSNAPVSRLLKQEKRTAPTPAEKAATEHSTASAAAGKAEEDAALLIDRLLGRLVEEERYLP